MSKRIFTVILALVLSLTALSFGAEANSSVAANSEAGDGTLITGDNCTLSVGATSSAITWNPVSGANYYQVIFTVNETSQSMVMSSYYTTATVPLGYNNCDSFTVAVIYVSSTGSGIAAAVSYNGNIVIPGKTINSDTDKISLTFDIPVYGLYGYLTAGDYMELDLPTYFGENVPAGVKISWYLQLDGKKYLLQSEITSSEVGAISSNTNRVVLSAMTHDFDGRDTAIPPVISYNALSSFKLVAELEAFSYPKNPDGSYKIVDEIIDIGALFTNDNAIYGRPISTVQADWFKSDATPISGSKSYAYSWNPMAVCFSSSSGQTPTPTPEPTPTVCEHTFEYQSCTEVHWKHCTKCGYTCEVGEHSAANGSCSVCGRSSTTSRFDVNGNGHVDLQDAVMILRRLAHLD